MVMSRRRQSADAVLHRHPLCRVCGTGESLCWGRRRRAHVIRWVGRMEDGMLEVSVECRSHMAANGPSIRQPV